MDREELRKISYDMKPWLIDVRRNFHMHPELGQGEYWTKAEIIRYLEDMGIEYQILGEGTAVVGLIRGGYEGGTVAIRADMDALPILENRDVPYKSSVNGVMHACGHDAHMTILLGTARLFNKIKCKLHGNIKLLFQPAEETVGGAEKMVQLGCMKNPDVDYVLGLHVMPHIPVGIIETKYGAINGASDNVYIIVKGKSAHGAYPELGTDAIMIAGQIITALQTLTSRSVSPLDSAVFTIGTINGGIKDNIISDEVRMNAILRTVNPTTREYLKGKIKNIVEGIASSLGGSAEVRIEKGYKALINSSEVVDAIMNTTREVLGEDSLVIREKPSMGVEDFSYFLDEAKGAFYHLGCANPEKSITSPLHTSTFDIDEDCLPLGVLMHSSIAIKLMEDIKSV